MHRQTAASQSMNVIPDALRTLDANPGHDCRTNVETARTGSPEAARDVLRKASSGKCDGSGVPAEFAAAGRGWVGQE